MARVNLELPDVFTFSTHLTVRVSDINYGNHLGNDRMISLLHEARLRYLHNYDFSEFNIGGVGLMVTDIVVSFVSESFVADRLTFKVGSLISTNTAVISFTLSSMRVRTKSWPRQRRYRF